MGNAQKSETEKNGGIEGDWGETMPWWCLMCGRGFVSVKRARHHNVESGHVNESGNFRVRGLMVRQQFLAFRMRYK